MNFKKYLLMISVSFLSQGTLVHAQDNLSTSSQKSCSWINLKEEEEGSICFTSEGGRFKRVKINEELGIQDLGSKGKVWFDAIKKRVNQYEAIEVCSSKAGQSLPTKADFELAESRGFREAFKRDMRDNFFWSSSVVAYSNDTFAYDFYGEIGGIGWDPRAITYAASAARCVTDL